MKHCVDYVSEHVYGADVINTANRQRFSTEQHDGSGKVFPERAGIFSLKLFMLSMFCLCDRNFQSETIYAFNVLLV